MKKVYEAPVLMIEKYALDTSIAANCNVIMNDRDMVCYDKWIDSDIETYAANRSFDDNNGVNCDCYYEAGGEGFFAS